MKPVIKILFFCFLIGGTCIPLFKGAYAQDLVIVKKIKIYEEEVSKDSSLEMLEIRSIVPSVIYDLRYASANNFTKAPLYKNGEKTYLRRPAAHALFNVQKELNSIGYGLKIFDAYRPYKITQRLWDLVGDERFAADPKKGSNHNRGLAVDVTLIDLKTKKELDMGSAFDSFSDTAHTSFIQLPKLALRNRFLLKELMIKHGFNIFETEWWHFSWPNDKNYSVLDLSFKELAKFTD